MDISAPHTGLVIASYFISAFCLIALCVVVLVRDRALTTKLRKQKDPE